MVPASPLPAVPVATRMDRYLLDRGGPLGCTGGLVAKEWPPAVALPVSEAVKNE